MKNAEAIFDELLERAQRSANEFAQVDDAPPSIVAGFVIGESFEAVLELLGSARPEHVTSPYVAAAIELGQLARGFLAAAGRDADPAELERVNGAIAFALRGRTLDS